MSTKKNGQSAPSSVGTVARNTGLATLRAVFGRRHVIIGCAAVAVCAALFFLLIQLLPRTVKPTVYKAGDMEIRAITEVVGSRKLLGMSESLSGLGRAESGEYSYKAGKAPGEDVEAYLKLLTEEYDAAVAEGASLGATEGSVTVNIPSGSEDKRIELTISYDSEKYLLAVDEKQIPKEKPAKVEAVITPEQARDILLTLTKAETGFKQDISVYTSNLEPDTVDLDGWDYYVFTVVADYSATRIEYRGTFYISCNDGHIMRYDKETDAATRIRREK